MPTVEEYRRGDHLAYLFIAVLLACAVLFFAGCQPEPSPSAEWTPAIERAWQDVTDCWRFDPGKRPTVVIETCQCCDGQGAQYFGGKVGTVNAVLYTAYVCPDLFALRHEMSHLVSYRMAGNTGIEDYGGQIPGNCYGVARYR